MNDAPVARLQRILPASPDVVFDQWLDPESLQEWMCPRPALVLAVHLEPRVGGRVRFDVDNSGTRVLISGHFLVIDRPHLLRFTWSASDWPDPTAVSVVSVAFEPFGDDQTCMCIEHKLVPPEQFDNYQNGWAVTADQLAALLLQGG